ncbi:MAG TPA: polysaccharide biosynthesis tyrosine autokinase [Jatrophihabitantaceae bacterium]|nr:polysaccharide biosynthesis tyrosine autokinase [Jatrophihabitantaceae bacterium]
MTLRTYLRIFRERWKVLVGVVLAAVIIAITITVTSSKVYQATTQLFVVSSDTTVPGQQYQGSAFTQLQVQTFAQIVASPNVLHAVQKDLDLPMSDSELKGKISATAPTSQSIVNLQVSDSDPARAAAIANSAAKAFVTQVEGYYATSGDKKTSTVRMYITDPATAPGSPSSPKPVLNIVLGLVLGLFAGIALAVARDVLDNRIKATEALVKVAGAPAMGTIVEDAATKRQVVAARAGSSNVRAENFRQLRANLQFAAIDTHPRIIAVTSAIPGEGKSTVAINLASTLAEAGFTVCLVDADLRRPAIAKALGLIENVGLTSVLVQQLSLDQAIQSAGAGLSVLTSGPTPPNPSEVLASSYVREVVRSLLNRVDYVVLDTAPLLPVADGSEVAALADGTLIVARHGVTTDTQVRRAVNVLRQLDVTVLGTVLNRIPAGRKSEYRYAYARDEADSRSRHSQGQPAPVSTGDIA